MDKYVNCRELCKIMYHQAFETDTPLQRWDSGCWIRYKMFEDVIDSIPAADVRPVVKSTWEEFGDGEQKFYSCSNCFATHYRWDNFCPNCGAVMEES